MRRILGTALAALMFVAASATVSFAQRNEASKNGDPQPQAGQENMGNIQPRDEAQSPAPPGDQTDQPGRRSQHRWAGSRLSSGAPSPATQEALNGPASEEDWKKWEPKITKLIADSQVLFDLARDKRRLLYNMERDRREAGPEEFSFWSPLARSKAEQWIAKAHEAIEKVRNQQEVIRKDLLALLAKPEEVKNAARYRLKSLIEDEERRASQTPAPLAEPPAGPGRGEQGTGPFRAMMERRFEQRLLEQLILHLDEMARQPEKIETLFDYDREPQGPQRPLAPPPRPESREQVTERLHRLEQENRFIRQKLEHNDEEIRRLQELNQTLPPQSDNPSTPPPGPPSDKK